MKKFLESTLETILGAFLALGSVLLGIAVVIFFAALISAVPWLLYNLAVAPLFDWPHCAFWKFFLIFLAANWVRAWLFPGKRGDQ